MHARSSGAADQERDRETFALHLARDMSHFLQRRRDEARQADDVGILAARDFQYFLRRHHDAEVDHLVVVALEHHGDDVLADVVHVALYRGDDHLAARPQVARSGLLGFDVGDEVRHGLLHDAGRLYHLGQEHLAGTEQVADDVHAFHERSLDHLDRVFGLEARLLGVLDDPGGDALHQRVRKTRVHRPPAPLQVLDALASRPFHRGGQFDQPFARVGASVHHHVLDAFAQLVRYLLVDTQLSGIDDAHGQAGAYGMVEKYRVYRFAHRVVAAKREGDVRYAAPHLGVGHVGAEPARCLDEVAPVVGVFVDPGCDGEDVWVEDDVLGREFHLLGENPVAAPADLDAPFQRVGLPALIERHDDHCRAVTMRQLRLAHEFLLAFLERDRVHDTFALHAFQTR